MAYNVEYANGLGWGRKKCHRPVEVIMDIGVVELPNNKHTIVDSWVASDVQRYCWTLRGAGYPFTDIGGKGGKRKIGLHRFVWSIANGPIPQGMYIDHVNRDILDNRLCNLRCVTPGGNRRNTKIYSKTGYRGVYKNGRGWAARISSTQDGLANHSRIYLGTFDTASEAAIAYNKKAIELGGIRVLNDV